MFRTSQYCSFSIFPKSQVNLQKRLLKRQKLKFSLAQSDSIPQNENNQDREQKSDQVKSSSWLKKKQRQLTREMNQKKYLVGAIGLSSLVSAIGFVATYYKFFFEMNEQEGFPWLQFSSTLLFVFGGVVAMEFYARWIHKYLWHDFEPGYYLHKSHHQVRKGLFEANDIYAIMNAAPALFFCIQGFFTPGVFGGLVFGIGLGITLYGNMYLFVHDGMVHKRFPVGPIQEWPYLKRIAAAHQIHHNNTFKGVPYGLFLGVQELEKVGGLEELDRVQLQLEQQRMREQAAFEK